MWTTKTLIRLRGWAGWFESSLDAHVRRYVSPIAALFVLTLSVPNFRRHLSSAFFLYFNKLTFGRIFIYVKLKDWMSNSVDPDETAHWAVSSGSMLFAKAYYYRLWQWKNLSFTNQSTPGVTSSAVNSPNHTFTGMLSALSEKLGWGIGINKGDPSQQTFCWPFQAVCL